MESPRHFIASPYPSSFSSAAATALLGSGERGGRKRREVGSDSLVGARCEERRRQEAAGAQLIFRKRRERRRSSEPINYENTTFLPPPRFPREKIYISAEKSKIVSHATQPSERTFQLFPFLYMAGWKLTGFFFHFQISRRPHFILVSQHGISQFGSSGHCLAGEKALFLLRLVLLSVYYNNQLV